MLTEAHVRDRAVVVFDVLRATTTIVTAISSGAKEVRIFGSLDAASLAASEFAGPKILAGESRCLAPPGFDLGNSPGDFTPQRVAGKTIFLSTTNGTRAIVAAQGAARLFVAGIVNVTAMANLLKELDMDVTLLCAGTDGLEAPEDEFGARLVKLSTEYQFDHGQRSYIDDIRETAGANNIVAAGLTKDIEFAAKADRFGTAVEVVGLPPIARKLQ